MSVKTLQRHWEEFARTNPFWAILANPNRTGGWEHAEFFATGEADVELLFSELARLELTCRMRRALDFGCGVGRVTRALATRFGEVVGLDISPEMVRLAKAYNEDRPGCTFAVNTSDRIAQPTGAFDFVYSRLVLQHIPPGLASGYVAELVRVLSPCGLLVFQLPTPEPRVEPEPVGWKRRLPFFLVKVYRRLRDARRRPFPDMAMHGMAVADVTRAVAAAGGSTLHVLPDQSHGDTWPGFLYVVTKPASA